jgi:gluconolactonase
MELQIFDDKIHNLIDESAPLEKLASGYKFVEGPAHVSALGITYFTDFMLNKIYKFDRKSGKITLIDDDSHYSIGLFYDKKKNRILRTARDLRSIADMDGNVIVHEYDGVPINGSNDVIVDSKGKIYFTDPLTRTIEGPQVGHSSVFCYDEETKKMDMLEDTLSFPNGLALSPDEKILYIAETKHSELYTLNMETRKFECFIKIDTEYGAGKPDGLRIDTLGNIYTTGPGGIWVISPEGKALALIKIPEVAANLCFDDTGLFITASTSIYHVNTKTRPAVSL